MRAASKNEKVKNCIHDRQVSTLIYESRGASPPHAELQHDAIRRQPHGRAQLLVVRDLQAHVRLGRRGGRRGVGGREPRHDVAVLEGVQGISRNMATAILNAQNMRDAFVSSIKAMAAEIMAQAATFALLNLFTGGTFGAGRGFLDFAFGHTGGLVDKSGIQKLHEGGMIGGNANNVPIVAQSGEFIMQRSAVQSIGLDNLSAMNETGQTSNIVVNIHGGVVQEDYVRNELIPAINRSGARVA